MTKEMDWLNDWLTVMHLSEFFQRITPIGNIYVKLLHNSDLIIRE